MRLDDRPGNEEAQPGPPDVHRALVEQAGELVEELGNVLVPDANPLVMDGDFGLAIFGGGGDHRDVAPAGRVLDRVVQEIEESLLQPPAVATHHQARLDAHPHWIATRVNRKEIDHLFDEVGGIETLEVVAELVVLDAVDSGEVLHQVGQAGGAAMNPIDERAPGFLVETVLLGQQGFRLRLDTGQWCLQLVRHHRNEVRADLVDLFQSFDAFFLQRLAAAGLIELGGALDRSAQRAVEPASHVTDQEARDQRDEEEEEDAADDKARRWRHRGEPGEPTDHRVQHRHDDRRGECTWQPEPNGRGDDQQVEQQREIGRGAVATGEIEDAGRHQEVDPRGEKAKPAPGFVAANEDDGDHQVDQAPGEEDGVHDDHRSLGVPVAKVVEDDGGG